MFDTSFNHTVGHVRGVNETFGHCVVSNLMKPELFGFLEAELVRFTYANIYQVTCACAALYVYIQGIIKDQIKLLTHKPKCVCVWRMFTADYTEISIN